MWVPIQEENEAPLGAEPRRDVGEVEGKDNGEGWILIQLRDLRSVVSSLSGVRGKAPAENGFSVI